MINKEIKYPQNIAHLIMSYNLQIFLNKFFAKNPKETINKKEFMELQKLVWQEVKKELKLEKFLEAKE